MVIAHAVYGPVSGLPTVDLVPAWHASAVKDCRIPLWDSCRYHDGMTTQIAVRLPDEMVAFLDECVATGKAASRATLVAAALEREMRLHAAQRDAELLRHVGAADDLDDLVAWSVTNAATED